LLELNKFCSRTNSPYAFSEAIDLHQEYNLAMLYIFLVSSVLESFLPAITVLVSCYLPDGTLVLIVVSGSCFLLPVRLLVVDCRVLSSVVVVGSWLSDVVCLVLVIDCMCVSAVAHFFHCRCPALLVMTSFAQSLYFTSGGYTLILPAGFKTQQQIVNFHFKWNTICL
jgi:hypothetical protein